MAATIQLLWREIKTPQLWIFNIHIHKASFVQPLENPEKTEYIHRIFSTSPLPYIVWIDIHFINFAKLTITKCKFFFSLVTLSEITIPNGFLSLALKCRGGSRVLCPSTLFTYSTIIVATSVTKSGWKYKLDTRTMRVESAAEKAEWNFAPILIGTRMLRAALFSSICTRRSWGSKQVHRHDNESFAGPLAGLVPVRVRISWHRVMQIRVDCRVYSTLALASLSLCLFFFVSCVCSDVRRVYIAISRARCLSRSLVYVCVYTSGLYVSVSCV